MMRAAPHARTLHSMAGISVLVVDHHALFADALRARLSREPDLTPVTAAYSAMEAKEEVARAKPDVIVLDLLLGEGDGGLDVAAAVRRSAPETRVIILTASESVAAVVPALVAGARAWLPKTVDVEHLLRVIRGVHAGEAWLSPQLLGQVLTDLAARAQPPLPDPLNRLTEREREVLQHMANWL